MIIESLSPDPFHLVVADVSKALKFGVDPANTSIAIFYGYIESLNRDGKQETKL